MEVDLLAGCELITTTGLDDGQLCGACDSDWNGKIEGCDCGGVVVETRAGCRLASVSGNCVRIGTGARLGTVCGTDVGIDAGRPDGGDAGIADGGEISQLSPLNPPAQVHSNPSPTVSHSAPFRQGPLEQWST